MIRGGNVRKLTFDWFMETQRYGWEVITLVLGVNGRKFFILNTRWRCFSCLKSFLTLFQLYTYGPYDMAAVVWKWVCGLKWRLVTSIMNYSLFLEASQNAMFQRYFCSLILRNNLMASVRFESSRTVMNHQMRKQLSVIEESSQESIEEQKILNDMRMIRWVSV